MQQPTAGKQSRTISQWALGFTLVVTAVAGAGAVACPIESKSDSLLPVREEPLSQYRALRQMHARSDRFDQEAWLTAWTDLSGREFRYTIVSERGSEYVRNKVLHAVLKREQELIADGGGQRSELTSENYDFQDATAGDGERYVGLKPKRKDMLLVDGRMVLSQDGTELLRVEGRLTRNPSFWTSLVSVVRHYARLDGVRVPIATESVARLRFAGLSHLDVRYDYETINGRAVSLAARTSPGSLTTR